MPATYSSDSPSSSGVTYSIVHQISFSYNGAVLKNRNQVRLRPRSDERQNCESFELRTDPAGEAREEEDQFGNRFHFFEVKGSHRALNLHIRSVVSMVESRAAGTMHVPLPVSAPDEISIPREAAGYLGLSPHVPYVPDVEELVLVAEKQSDGTAAGFAEAAARLVRSRFRYRSGVTHVGSSIVDLLKTKAGVCQDFAHLLIAICRWRGVPARYVSGYLAPGYLSDPSYKGDRLFRTAAGHAWVEFFSPSAGWVGIDPTLGVAPAERHIRIAYGRDYNDAAPVTGVYQGSEQSSVQSTIEISAL